MPSSVRADVREQMWNEQKHLCAYCMRRIDSPSVVRIEHCRPRHPKDEIVHDKKQRWILNGCWVSAMGIV